jgi:uncharacterized membrane protein
MSIKERVLHAILFEFFALMLVIPLVILITGKGVRDVVIVGGALSFYTIFWNYFYNIWFDNKFGHNRIERLIKLRVIHGIGFEAGLVFVSVPMVSWFLDIDLLAAFMLEALFLGVFFFYAIGFNWLFDWSRSKLYKEIANH